MRDRFQIDQDEINGGYVITDEKDKERFVVVAEVRQRKWADWICTLLNDNDGKRKDL